MGGKVKYVPVPPEDRKPMGRKPHEPNADMARKVKTMAAMGINTTDIGKVIGLSAPTITKYYMQELETGQIEALALVAQSLHRQALKGHVTACIFILKCKAGWREDGGEQPGKKEAQDLLAKVADQGTKWDGLLSE